MNPSNAVLTFATQEELRDLALLYIVGEITEPL